MESFFNSLDPDFKNERLKKYEAVKGVVQIDIYLPHFSEIGIPVEVLLQQPNSIEGFTLLQPDYLLTLKIYTLGQRGRTAKGQKDFLDIISGLIVWDIFNKLV